MFKKYFYVIWQHSIYGKMAEFTFFKNMRLRIFLLTLCSCLLSLLNMQVYAQGESNQNLLQKGELAKKNNNYSIALEYFINAERQAQKAENFQGIYEAKRQIGMMYGHYSNYGEALNYFLEALTILQEHPTLYGKENKLKQADILNAIGVLYYLEKEFKKARDYYKQAYDINKVEGHQFEEMTFNVNMAAVNNELGNLDIAKNYLDEIATKKKSKKVGEAWKITYAENLLLRGKPREAEQILQKLFSKTKKEPGNLKNIFILISLAEAQAAQNEVEKAIVTAKKGLLYNQKIANIRWDIPLYKQLSRLYFLKEEYETARKYRDSVVFTKDSLAHRINRQLFEANKVKLKVQEYQNQLKANNEKRKRDLITFIACGLFILVIFFSIYNGQRNRIIKQRQEKQLAANKQKITKLELKELKGDIAEKNRKLTAKALYLSDRNEIIEKIIESLANIPKVREDKEALDQMRTLKQQLRNDAEWDKFINLFESVNPQFSQLIKTRYPKLNSNDMRFLCHIYMNLDLKEISTILGISPEAAKKRKQRIARKMGIPVSKLQDHISSLGA